MVERLTGRVQEAQQRLEGRGEEVDKVEVESSPHTHTRSEDANLADDQTYDDEWDQSRKMVC
jgi:hypothetical protein